MFLAPIFSSTGVNTGDLGHSMRFRGAQYISKTITTSATSTYSFFVKRGKLGVISPIVESSIKFNENDTLTAFGLTTTAVFRDPTSWVHVHISNGGLYVNGVSLGAVTTSSVVNGRIGYNGTNYFDGYLARVCVVDGASSSYSNFCYLNTEINEWVSKTQAQVKAVVDAGGTNSFMLDFDDGASLTTLGYDKSSKGNNWTLNNFSLTAGVDYDWMLDVPGNSYCTLNPLQQAPSAVCARANLRNSTNASGFGRAHSTFYVSSGKWYWESTISFASIGNNAKVGVGTTYADNYIGAVSGDAGGTWSTSAGQILAIALDMDNLTVTGYRNGVAVIGPISIPSGSYCPLFADEHLAGDYCIHEVNFGQAPLNAAASWKGSARGYFVYEPPTGFKALCQANLPEVAIKNPTQHFQAKLDTGANIKSTSEAVFPSNFLEWIKDRANSNNHQLIDIVRGSSAVLQSNTTAVETIYSAPSGSSVGWIWKAGGAAVTNNAGSIQSQVSANVEAGFSIVTATLTGTNATLGHGQGSIPELIIGFRRNAAGTSRPIYCSALTSAAYAMYLDTTAAQASLPTIWNSTAPTSSVFSVGTGLTGDWVFYCFRSLHGYSKIGSYVGNGSADGPFVHCGFKPRWVMVKCSSSTGSWRMYDSARPGYNVIGGTLLAEGAGAETTAAEVDFTSSGFKLRVATDPNAAQTYIYYAIADVAGKYSLGR